MALVNDLRVSFIAMGTATCESGSMPSVAMAFHSSSLGIAADDLTPFTRDRGAFYRKLPELLRIHPGKYVVISGGRVAAVGESENETAWRFFREHPDADFYIGFIGDEPPAYQIRPASR